MKKMERIKSKNYVKVYEVNRQEADHYEELEVKSTDRRGFVEIYLKESNEFYMVLAKDLKKAIENAENCH